MPPVEPAAVERLERIWNRLADGDPELMPSGFMPLVAQLARKGESLHDQQTLAGLLDDELATKTFDGLALPFSCVARIRHRQSPRPCCQSLACCCCRR